jgi:predicted transcriptional regulator
VQVKDLMSTEVVTVQVDQPVADLFDVLQAAHIKGAPVLCDEGTLVGFVSQEDVMFGSLGSEMGEGGATIGEIMTSPAMSVTETTSVQDVARMMWRFRIHHMPVLDGEQLVGIVSSLDFCRAAADPETSAKMFALEEIQSV